MRNDCKGFISARLERPCPRKTAAAGAERPGIPLGSGPGSQERGGQCAAGDSAPVPGANLKVAHAVRSYFGLVFIFCSFPTPRVKLASFCKVLKSSRPQAMIQRQGGGEQRIFKKFYYKPKFGDLDNYFLCPVTLCGMMTRSPESAVFLPCPVDREELESIRKQTALHGIAPKFAHGCPTNCIHFDFRPFFLFCAQQRRIFKVTTCPGISRVEQTADKSRTH